MNRRKFIGNTLGASAGLLITKDLFALNKGPVYGHNDMKYTLDTQWSKSDSVNILLMIVMKWFRTVKGVSFC